MHAMRHTVATTGPAVHESIFAGSAGNCNTCDAFHGAVSGLHEPSFIPSPGNLFLIEGGARDVWGRMLRFAGRVQATLAGGNCIKVTSDPHAKSWPGRVPL